MKFCTKCGTQNVDSATFCSNCGNSLISNPNENIVNQEKNEDIFNNSTQSINQPVNNVQQDTFVSQPNYSSYNDDSNKGSFGFALIGFLIPIVGIILYFAMKSDKPGKAKSAIKGALVSIIIGVVLGVVAAIIPIIKGGSSEPNNGENTSITETTTNNAVNNDIVGYWANSSKTIIFTINKSGSSISSGSYYMELLGEGMFIISNSISYTSSSISASGETINYSLSNNVLTLNIDSNNIKFNRITESEFKSLETKLSESINQSSSNSSTEDNSVYSNDSGVYDTRILGKWVSEDGKVTLSFTNDNDDFMLNSSEGYSSSVTMNAMEIEVYTKAKYSYSLTSTSLTLTDISTGKVTRYTKE